MKAILAAHLSEQESPMFRRTSDGEVSCLGPFEDPFIVLPEIPLTITQNGDRIIVKRENELEKYPAGDRPSPIIATDELHLTDEIVRLASAEAQGPNEQTQSALKNALNRFIGLQFPGSWSQ